jgi:hypothetical protein
MKMKLELDHQYVNVILQVLVEAPYKVSAPVISEIQKQLTPNEPKTPKSGDTAA